MTLQPSTTQGFMMFDSFIDECKAMGVSDHLVHRWKQLAEGDSPPRGMAPATLAQMQRIQDMYEEFMHAHADLSEE